jgi:hypothetical protein
MLKKKTRENMLHTWNDPSKSFSKKSRTRNSGFMEQED